MLAASREDTPSPSLFPASHAEEISSHLEDAEKGISKGKLTGQLYSLASSLRDEQQMVAGERGRGSCCGKVKEPGFPKG